MDDKRFQITFGEEFVIMRTLDNLDYPVDIWRFKKSELSTNEKVFIENMLSMSKSMISDVERKNKDK